ncbi:Uncharacterised protein [Streptococcus suis]|uniref:Uncharacterized protein n=1 Tax=Streptococcus suis TaxID=1307 RepID=A0A0Z8MK43_STRSU|nr:Uncharacterised protein [Streptococcus suis]
MGKFYLPQHHEMMDLAKARSELPMTTSRKQAMNDLADMVMAACIRADSTSYSRCCYCHKSTNGEGCSHCKYI